MNVTSVLRRMEGAARYSSLVKAGVGQREIRSALAQGVIERPLRGCFALPTTPWDRVLACYFNARITCLSAADALGLRVLERAKVPHLELDAARGGHHRASAAHRMVHLHRTRTHEPGGSLVSVARAIDVASMCTSPLGQLVMVDHAMSLGWLDGAEIDRFEVTPLTMRRWLRKAADPKSGSVPETCARVALRAAGLTVETQVEFGNRRFADMLVDGRLFVEIDGFEHHSGRGPFEDDRARDEQLSIDGYRVMRFTYNTAVHDPARLVRSVRATLDAKVR